MTFSSSLEVKVLSTNTPPPRKRKRAKAKLNIGAVKKVGAGKTKKARDVEKNLRNHGH